MYTMYCLTNMCFVCLEKKDDSLIDIKSSLSVNEDIIHIIGYLPCNLSWLKSKRIILICEECCRRLRETYQLLAMCLKNSAVLQGYMNKINARSISTADNEAELRVDLNEKHNDIDRIKCEIILEESDIYTFESGSIIEETEGVFVNVDDYFVKEEDTWISDEIDDKEGPPMENNSTESSDNETDSAIAVIGNTRDPGTNSDSTGFTSTQVHATNKNELNTPAKKSHKCLTCSKSFSKKSLLQGHARVHTGGKPYKCAICEKLFNRKSSLVRHMRLHTGEKPYECARCKKCFSDRSNLVCHMRIHTGEKPYKCSKCDKDFSERSNLRRHMLIHMGEKLYECSRCKKCFNAQGSLVRHMRTHTDEMQEMFLAPVKFRASYSNI